MFLNYAKSVANTIKQLRLEHSLTQEQLAFELNISTSYIGMIERGERNISLKSIYEVSNYFKIKPSELLRFAERNF